MASKMTHCRQYRQWPQTGRRFETPWLPWERLNGKALKQYESRGRAPYPQGDGRSCSATRRCSLRHLNHLLVAKSPLSRGIQELALDRERVGPPLSPDNMRLVRKSHRQPNRPASASRRSSSSAPLTGVRVARTRRIGADQMRSARHHRDGLRLGGSALCASSWPGSAADSGGAGPEPTPGRPLPSPQR